MMHNLLRMIPKVDQLLVNEEVLANSAETPREKLTEIIRAELDNLREMIIKESMDVVDEQSLLNNAVDRVVHALTRSKHNSLRPVINATGVVLHTNLGRANLSEKAREAINSVVSNYSTLEYNPAKRARGSRHDHVESIITRMTGAEAAMVVNNNAAATMLTLASMGSGREIIVSRGELVEIGGSFRIPDIMEQSGASLIEVGTTNKTKPADYENRINEETAALLKVHTSNYKIIGFTQEASIEDLKKIGKKYDLPVIYDMGSGLMVDLSEYGIKEPTVTRSFKSGADVVLFSGDKLLGGPQAGIIAGKKKYIDAMKAHPLARVFRVDKMTLAAVEATFKEYYSFQQAKENIPVIKMLTRTVDELQQSAECFKQMIDAAGAGYTTEIAQSDGLVGGGSAPDTVLRNVVVTLQHDKLSCNEIDKMLHEGENIIVARIHENKVIFDMRTLFEEDYEIIADRLKEIAR